VEEVDTYGLLSLFFIKNSDRAEELIFLGIFKSRVASDTTGIHNFFQAEAIFSAFMTKNCLAAEKTNIRQVYRSKTSTQRNSGANPAYNSGIYNYNTSAAVG
jgi:hypothetical protein